MKIGIQGFKASFHEIAALKFFGNDIETVDCATFGKLFATLQSGEADYAICAIENSLAGAILPNYALLRNHDFEIFGEVYLRIEMNLMALPNQRIEDLEEVHSHPIALLQCRNFFEPYPNIQLIESFDTALSAEEIKKHHIRHRGAIASKRAAEIYDLEILAEDIHDNKRNFTRFLAIKKRNQPALLNHAIINKASLSFRAHHSPGSLAKVLTIIGDKNINLTKIQSLPVIGEEWQYYMYIDLEFTDESDFRAIINDIQPYTTELKILGAYAAGEKLM
ncbi:MAG TPA: prephenate dehydratase [Chitinophagales bacterium]|nr:prephenate dehydratase [Chitinophagales bacterium]